jgi:hypothetical protein
MKTQAVVVLTVVVMLVLGASVYHFTGKNEVPVAPVVKTQTVDIPPSSEDPVFYKKHTAFDSLTLYKDHAVVTHTETMEFPLDPKTGNPKVDPTEPKEQKEPEEQKEAPTLPNFN